MVMRSATANVALKHDCRSSGQSAILQPKRVPIIGRVVLLMLVTLILVGTGVIAIAKVRKPSARVNDPSLRLLPGSPRPMNATCNALHDGRFRCYVHHKGKEVYLAYDGASQMIIGAVISANEYTIGDLIISWGTPTGFTQDGRAIEVSWGTRSVYLHTCSFRPTSHVGYIEYGLESKQLPPWRGFIRRGEQC